MIEADLPEPEYKEELGGFSVYFYKGICTEENLRKMELNERQIKAVMYVKEKEKIANKEYQELCNTSERTATRDLSELVKREIFDQLGSVKATEALRMMIEGEEVRIETVSRDKYGRAVVNVYKGRESINKKMKEKIK